MSGVEGSVMRLLATPARKVGLRGLAFGRVLGITVVVQFGFYSRK